MMPNGLNIAALSRRTGVAPDTLRKWEQRYGILQPARTAGGQRRYGEIEVARVEWLRARLSEGFRIGEAAALLGAGRTEASLTPAQLRRSLHGAVERAEAVAIGRLLDQAFALGRLESILADVVRPVLERIGDDWAAGHEMIAGEHLLAAAVRARLERLLSDARGTVRGTAVLACPAGERHELGLLALAVMLQEDGWQVAYLGADIPIGSVLDFAAAVSARVVCLGLCMEHAAGELERALNGTEIPEGVELVLGGPGATHERVDRLGALYAGCELGPAVERLRTLTAA